MEQKIIGWDKRLKALISEMTFNERVAFLIRYAKAHRMRRFMGKIPLARTAKSRRADTRVMYRGELVTLVELSKKTGIPYSTLYSRIKEYGWPVERAARK